MPLVGPMLLKQAKVWGDECVFPVLKICWFSYHQMGTMCPASWFEVTRSEETLGSPQGVVLGCLEWLRCPPSYKDKFPKCPHGMLSVASSVGVWI